MSCRNSSRRCRCVDSRQRARRELTCLARAGALILVASQAEALFERASALERRALLLSCTEADELEHAGSVLVGAEPLQPSPSGAGGARRGNKRKQRSVKAEAATGVADSTPALRGDA